VTHIEVYADVACPFAHAGLLEVARTRARRRRDDFLLIVHAWPLELVNGTPLDPDTTAEHIEILREQVTPTLFSGFDPAFFPATSLPALAVAARAYRHSDFVGEATSLALRQALFEEGLDISQPGVLRQISASLDVGEVEAVDRDAVLADWHRGQALGVKGSPHFFCGDREVFCPSLDISRDAEGHLRIHRSLDELNTFLDYCFDA